MIRHGEQTPEEQEPAWQLVDSGLLVGWFAFRANSSPAADCGMVVVFMALVVFMVLCSRCGSDTEVVQEPWFTNESMVAGDRQPRRNPGEIASEMLVRAKQSHRER